LVKVSLFSLSKITYKVFFVRLSGFHYFLFGFSNTENKLKQEQSKLEKVEDIPEYMNDPKATFKDIKFSGDLKGRF
jgi:hemolysin activation/secretion protein